MGLWQWLARQVSPFIDTTVHARLIILEDRMAKTDKALADLDEATNAVAAELEDLRDDVAQYDASLADKITAKAERLRTLAADPALPVPAEPEPAPVETTPTEVPTGDTESQDSSGPTPIAGVNGN